MSGLAAIQDWCYGSAMPGVPNLGPSVVNPGTSAASGVFGEHLSGLVNTRWASTTQGFVPITTLLCLKSFKLD